MVADRGSGLAGSSVGLDGLSNQLHSGGWRQVGSARSYWLQDRKPASLTGAPGSTFDPPSAHGPGSTRKLSVGSPREETLSSQQLPSPWSSHQKSLPLCRTSPDGVMPIVLATVWL